MINEKEHYVLVPISEYNEMVEKTEEQKEKITGKAVNEIVNALLIINREDPEHMLDPNVPQSVKDFYTKEVEVIVIKFLKEMR